MLERDPKTRGRVRMRIRGFSIELIREETRSGGAVEEVMLSS